MLDLRSRNLFCTAFGLALTAGLAQAQPERTAAGRTLQVPDHQKALGTLYYVLPGKDAQVTFTSDAPLEHIKGTSNQVVGYLVAGGKPDGADFAVKAGVFRLPVKSLDTGIPLRNEHLQGERWMNAGSYPDVIYVVTGARNVQVAKQSGDFTTLTMDLTGTMQIKATKKEMTVPARITMMPASEKTRARAEGNLAAIRAAFPLKMSDFKVGAGDPAMESGKIADELQLDVFLLFSTESPDK